MKKSEAIILPLHTWNQPAKEHLYTQYYSELKTQALYLVKDPMDAEDIVQDLFMDVLDNNVGSNAQISLLSYLKTCLYHKCLVHLARRERRRKHYMNYLKSIPVQGGLHQYRQWESESICRRMLGKLPSQRQEVCKLVYLENKSYKEAAYELGITINSLKTHLKLANKNLRDRFHDSKMQLMESMCG
jgi:RNA polymerase sigma factor (sigma-70 family)